jgi:Transposase, Mutator family
MTLSKSALSDLLDALRAGGDLDLIREGLALVLQALIEAEATQHIGARPYERSEQRTTHRNGTRSRLLSSKAGGAVAGGTIARCSMHHLAHPDRRALAGPAGQRSGDARRPVPSARPGRQRSGEGGCAPARVPCGAAARRSRPTTG